MKLYFYMKLFSKFLNIKYNDTTTKTSISKASTEMNYQTNVLVIN